MCGPVHLGNHRLRQIPDLPEQVLVPSATQPVFGRVPAMNLLSGTNYTGVLGIPTRAKGLTSSSEHHHAAGLIPSHLVERFQQLGPYLLIYGIEPFRTIQRDRRNPGHLVYKNRIEDLVIHCHSLIQTAFALQKVTAICRAVSKRSDLKASLPPMTLASGSGACGTFGRLRRRQEGVAEGVDDRSVSGWHRRFQSGRDHPGGDRGLSGQVPWKQQGPA